MDRCSTLLLPVISLREYHSTIVDILENSVGENAGPTDKIVTCGSDLECVVLVRCWMDSGSLANGLAVPVLHESILAAEVLALNATS